MTKITANSMKCASVGGCAHTAVVHLARKGAAPVKQTYGPRPAARPGTAAESTPKTKIKSE